MMQQEIIGSTEWIRIDGTNGTFFVLLEFVSRDSATWNGEYLDRDDERFGAIREDVGDYYEGGASCIESVEIIEGFGGRLSMPGYMDCTDWIVADTAEEIQDTLDDMYGEDE